jgi:hypothetical protein
MNGRTTSGIAAIWRSGEVRESSVIPLDKQSELKRLGDTVITAATAGLLAAHNFPEPEWRDPRQEYLTNNCVAYHLGQLAAQYDGLTALVLRDATEADFGDIGIGLQTAVQAADESGRRLLDIASPHDRGMLELSRSIAAGRLYIPCGQRDQLDGEGMRRLLADAPVMLSAPVQLQAEFAAAVPAAA